MNNNTLNAYIAQLLVDVEENEARQPIEVFLNKQERSCLDLLHGGLGRSPYFRNLLHVAARTHGMAQRTAKEPRAAGGLKRASRGAAGPAMMRRQV